MKSFGRRHSFPDRDTETPLPCRRVREHSRNQRRPEPQLSARDLRLYGPPKANCCWAYTFGIAIVVFACCRSIFGRLFIRFPASPAYSNQANGGQNNRTETPFVCYRRSCVISERRLARGRVQLTRLSLCVRSADTSQMRRHHGDTKLLRAPQNSTH